MRTITFRGWDPRGKGWVYGSLYNGRQEDEKEYRAILPLTDTKTDPGTGPDEDKVHFRFGDEFVVVEYDSVGQFVMKDRNGLDIYEGDIVIQEYQTDTCHPYGFETDEPVRISGFHLGTVRMTTEGVQIHNTRHFDSNGTLTPEQPSKSRRIQMRSYRSQLAGNVFEHPELTSSQNISNHLEDI